MICFMFDKLNFTRIFSSSVVSKLRGSKLMGMLYLISITKMVCMVNFFGLNDRYICILHDLGDILEV